MIDLALQKPRSLGYPFEVWTLGRLQTAFTEKTGIHLLIQRSGNGSKRRVCVGNVNKVGFVLFFMGVFSFCAVLNT